MSVTLISILSSLHELPVVGIPRPFQQTFSRVAALSYMCLDEFTWRNLRVGDSCARLFEILTEDVSSSC